MATQNRFELLGDEEDDASAVIERAEAVEKVKKKRQQQEKTQPVQQQDPPKLPAKPLPPAQAVREAKPSQQEVGRGRGGRGRGNATRDRDSDYDNRTRNRDFNGGLDPPSEEGFFPRSRNFAPSGGYSQDVNGFQTNRGRFYGVQGRPVQNFGEDGDSGYIFEAGRGSGGRFRGSGRRQGRAFGGFGEGQQLRAYVRKDTAGGLDEAHDKPEIEHVKEDEAGKQSVSDEAPVEEPKKVEEAVEVKKEHEEEENEMSLDEYYKVLDEKTKHLKSQRLEERKVILDKDFAKMTKVEKKPDTGDFVKLAAEKDKGKKKEASMNADEKVKKSMSINEFLRPAEGEQYSSANGRDRRRDVRGKGPNERGDGYRGSSGVQYSNVRLDAIPHIEDQNQFPTLGAA